MNCHRPCPLPKARSQNTSAHIQKASIRTSHINVVLETQNAGVTIANTVASNGRSHHLWARE